MTRFVLHAVPLLLLLLALFGFAVELLDFEPRTGSVIRLALLEQPRVPATVVIGTWLVEAGGLLALFLLAQGRCGAWWLDGLVAGWVGWIFRGPLLVVTIVVAARQPQQAWWTLAFGWWVLYSVCGLSLAVLARREQLAEEAAVAVAVKDTAILARELSEAAAEPAPAAEESPALAPAPAEPEPAGDPVAPPPAESDAESPLGEAGETTAGRAVEEG